jgi:hypothetical protein
MLEWIQQENDMEMWNQLAQDRDQWQTVVDL